jgi:hypothetical protein
MKVVLLDPASGRGAGKGAEDGVCPTTTPPAVIAWSTLRTFLATCGLPMFGSLFSPYFVHAPGDENSADKRFVHSANAKALDLLLRSRRSHT